MTRHGAPTSLSLSSPMEAPNRTVVLACLDAPPTAQPLSGLRCTLHILPYVAIHDWDLVGEWLFVLVYVLLAWACCSACCCCLPLRCGKERKRASLAAADSAHATAYEPSDAAAHALHTPPPRGCAQHVSFSIREAGGGAAAVPTPALPPPPPPPGCGPGMAQMGASTEWREHVDPSTGDKYYEDGGGNVTWDEPPAHMIVRANEPAAHPPTLVSATI